jgi:PPP family 3-phenylpropionic acid transporter
MPYETGMNIQHQGPPRFIISSQYFLYFGVMGMFLPYFNLYCYHLGFSGFQIGILSAVRSVTLVFCALIWGGLADRFQIRRPIYIGCNFLCTAVWVFYLYTTDFRIMFAITLFYGLFYAPIIPFLEAFTMDVLGDNKKSYGRIRAWGSISFILIVIVLGKIIDLYSIKIILVLILIGSCLQALMALRIPDIRLEKKASFRPQAKVLLNRQVVFFLICAFLMLVSHGAYYGFFSIHLETLGYAKTLIGMNWALASTAEILVMIKSNQIFKRFSLEDVLIFSFIVAAIRWLVLFGATSLPVILLSQVLHAITYGTFHMACILTIDRLTPNEAKTLGQAVNNAVTYGLGLMVGFFINGYLYETMNTAYLFLISSMIALTGGMMLKGSQLVKKKDSNV